MINILTKCNNYSWKKTKMANFNYQLWTNCIVQVIIPSDFILLTGNYGTIFSKCLKQMKYNNYSYYKY